MKGYFRASGLLCVIFIAVFLSSCSDGGGSGKPSGIGTEGGVVNSDDTLASVNIPSGALPQIIDIKVVPANSVPEGNIGQAYEFTPDGISFDNNITISISYNEEDLPDGTEESSLRLAIVVNSQWQAISGSSVDETNNIVSGPASHFSIYGIIENNEPVASAGFPQLINLNELVQLDGSASVDADSDVLTFHWEIISKPSGSNAELSDPSIVNPTFIADLPGSYEIRLTVSDNIADTIFDTVIIDTNAQNIAPVANAGLDLKVLAGNKVTLDGGSSTDINGNLLSFIWSFKSVPQGSIASLSDSEQIRPSFTPDLAGDYVVSLIVSDGDLSSVEDIVTVSTENIPPVASSGPDQTVIIDSAAELNGEESTDVDGDLLSLRWSLTSIPPESNAELSDTDSFNPSFIADLPGTYIAQLIASDSNSSAIPDTVVISTENSRPIANAGPDRKIVVSETVQLDASNSHDGDGDILNYKWAMVVKPEDSLATLANAATSNPDFTADVPGIYIAQLIVDDGLLESTPDTVTLSTGNLRPVAHAGENQEITVGAGTVVVALDGNGSTDADGDELDYRWSLISKPLGSEASIDDRLNADSSFTADRPGYYLAQLIVSDDEFASLPDTVLIKAENNPPVLEGIGNKNIPLGSSLNLQLVANDPDGDDLSYFANPVPLPENSSFDSLTGLFTFTPSELQTGEFEISFTITDGQLSDSETITIVVEEAPDDGITALKGRILDTNDFVRGVNTPVVGATVSILESGIAAVSDENGDFILEAIPAGDRILDIATSTANPSPDGDPSAGFREKIFLIEGVTNDITRPFYLPRIDASSLTVVNPSETTNVVNPNLDISVTVPPNTAKGEDGSNFMGSLSISEVPEGLAPAALPEELDPGLLITIQPVGVTFSTPVPITFPNIDNLAPGSEVDIWSLDPVTGQFIVVGTGLVSDDGTVIETISGGIRAADWHAILPPALTGENGENNPDFKDPDKCEEVCSGSVTAIASGNLRIEHALAPYLSLGQLRGPVVVYNSEYADPRPVLSMSATLSRRSAVPPTISSKVTVANIALPDEIFTDTSTLNESVDETIRQVVQIDGREMTTGLYPYRFTQTSNFSRSRVSNIIGGNLLVNNMRSSSLGAGWGLENVARLQENFDGSILITEGGGKSLVFKPAPLDLNRWTKEGVAGNGNWNVEPDGLSVIQTINGNPTFFVSPDSFIDTTIRGTFKVETGGDDDFIGFVFGYKSPLNENGDDVYEHEFLLLDWKQGNQSGALEGFALSRVKGRITDFVPGFWTHSSSPEFEVLATDFGNDKGWFDNTEHNFELVYNSDRIRVIIDGRLIFDVEGSFEAGRFGFYNYSQAQVRYRSFTSTNFFTPPDGDFSFLERNPDGTFTRTLKNGTEVHFSENGLQSAVIDRNGNITVFEYDDEDRLISVTDPVGKITTLTYTGSNLSQITDPAGRITLFEHDDTGNLIRITDPDDSIREFTYDESHHLTSQTSKRGDVTSYIYDFSGRHIASIWPDGSLRGISSARTVGLIASGSESGSESIPATVVRPTEAISTFTDGNGNVTSYVTDRFGSSTSTIDALGRQTRITRDENGDPIRIVRPGGGVAVMSYDENGNLLSLTEETNGATVRFTYAPEFNLVSTITDQEGNVTRQDYDSDGNLIKITDPLGGEQSFTYNSQGLPLTSSDENGNITAFTYDASGNLELLTDALGNITKFVRDDVGNVTRTIEAFGSDKERFSSAAYDDLNRILSITAADNGVTNFIYDENGNVLELQNATGQVVKREYDSRDRVILIDDPVSGITRRSYDSNGNLSESVDALGNETKYEYDSGNQLVKTIDALNQETVYSYDNDGNLVSLKDARGQETGFTYDLLGRLLEETSPGGHVTTSTYDLRNNLKTVTDPKGQLKDYIYDELSRLERITAPDDVIEFTYDAFGNTLTAVDGDSNLEFSYDELNRIKTAETAAGGVQPEVTLTYDYDEFSNRVNLTDSASGSVSYEYDDVNRLIRLNTSAGDVISQSYDLAGRLLKITRPGSISDYAYDTRGRLETINHSSDVLGYSYNDVGNITSILESTGTREFTYDGLHRLIGGGTSSTPENYTYDEVGNRISSHISESHNHDDDNRLLEDSGFTYAYDDNGNLITKTSKADDSVTSYIYDSFNRLTQVNLPDGNTASYSYDALGRRIGKNIDGALTSYIYDGEDIFLEYDGANALQARYSHGQQTDQPLVMERGGQSYFYQADHLGSISKLTNSSGTAVNAYEYDAYGRIESITENVANPYAYTSRELDQENGLYHYRARTYNPQTGRFLQQDPIGFAAGDANFYRYVFNNPQNFTDPSGFAANYVAGGAIRLVGGRTVSIPISRFFQRVLGNKAGRLIACVTVFECSVSDEELDTEDNAESDENIRDDENKKDQCIARCYPLLEDTNVSSDIRTYNFFKCLNACMEEDVCE